MPRGGPAPFLFPPTPIWIFLKEACGIETPEHMLPFSSGVSIKATVSPLTLILFKPLLTFISHMLWLKSQQKGKAWKSFECKLNRICKWDKIRHTHMLSTKVGNEIRIDHMRHNIMCSREKCGDSFADPSYNEHLFIITFLAILQTARLWMNAGIYYITFSLYYCQTLFLFTIISLAGLIN